MMEIHPVHIWQRSKLIKGVVSTEGLRILHELTYQQLMYRHMAVMYPKPPWGTMPYRMGEELRMVMRRNEETKINGAYFPARGGCWKPIVGGTLLYIRTAPAPTHVAVFHPDGDLSTEAPLIVDTYTKREASDEAAG